MINLSIYMCVCQTNLKIASFPVHPPLSLSLKLDSRVVSHFVCYRCAAPASLPDDAIFNVNTDHTGLGLHIARK